MGQISYHGLLKTIRGDILFQSPLIMCFLDNTLFGTIEVEAPQRHYGILDYLKLSRVKYSRNLVNGEDIQRNT